MWSLPVLPLETNQQGQVFRAVEIHPDKRLIIDMDCEQVTKSQAGKKCDYIFICEDSRATWVVPIELKGGGQA